MLFLRSCHVVIKPPTFNQGKNHSKFGKEPEQICLNRQVRTWNSSMSEAGWILLRVCDKCHTFFLWVSFLWNSLESMRLWFHYPSGCVRVFFVLSVPVTRKLLLVFSCTKQKGKPQWIWAQYVRSKRKQLLGWKCFLNSAPVCQTRGEFTVQVRQLHWLLNLPFSHFGAKIFLICINKSKLIKCCISSKFKIGQTLDSKTYMSCVGKSCQVVKSVTAKVSSSCFVTDL